MASRPHSISELANEALSDIYNPQLELKKHIRAADKLRKSGNEALKEGDLETAFVRFARAATLVLEKVPTHRDYLNLLSEEQRRNLGLNGQMILDDLGRIKPRLVTRFDEWRTRHPDVSLEDWDRDYEQQREAAEKAQMDQVLRREEENRKRNAAAAAAAAQQQQQQQQQYSRRVEDRPIPGYKSTVPDYSFSQQQQVHGSQNTIVVMPEALQKRRMEQDAIQQRQQQSEAEERRIRQAIAAINAGAKSRSSLSANSSVSSSFYASTQTNTTAVTTPASSFYDPSSTSIPIPISSPETNFRVPSASVIHDSQPAPAPVFSDPPLLQQFGVNRTPTRATVGPTYQVPPLTTTSPPPIEGPLSFPTLMSPHQQRQGYYPSMESMFASMSLHGQHPHSHSQPHSQIHPHSHMTNTAFNTATATANMNMNTNLSWASQEANRSAAAAAAANVGRNLYESGSGGNSWGRGREPRRLSKYDVPPPPPPLPSQQSQSQSQIPPGPPLQPRRYRYPTPSPPPPPPQPQFSNKTKTKQMNLMKEFGGSGGKKLKRVTMPRECLPRFLAIAKVNTACNKETCGMLLGREIDVSDDEDGRRGDNNNNNNNNNSRKKPVEMGIGGAGSGGGDTEYIVTTLLVPKQRGTSDTCVMLEEELVMGFTEEKRLITLGWIHTHPSQSCFMSSVDLHTHSAFQRMLPESFAVVCAPQSKPNFGIFRLTDPPGLQTILNCQEKESFHPHPDIPIYTDADKGHVIMKDSPLEIVDLR